ncbi:MAG: TetR/AcrR family transcriptional regulator [Betaproteobacteria bacterium]|nr:TetR/AcrR family transcriptional regulator [Betaproteobacteria bacterium]
MIESASGPPPAPDTRSRILDVAEALFVEHGFEATTTRLITGAARVNLAAVNYHFGSKEALIQDVFRRRLGWLNQQRLEALDALEAAAAGAPLKPSQILDAFFGVALRFAADRRRGGHIFMRLLGRTYTEPNAFVRAFLAAEHAGLLERYKAALFRALPDVPPEEILWRLHFMVGAMAYALSGADALRLVTGMEGAGASDVHPEALAPRLMSFLLGGLRAPLPVLPAGDVMAAKGTVGAGLPAITAADIAGKPAPTPMANHHPPSTSAPNEAVSGANRLREGAPTSAG